MGLLDERGLRMTPRSMPKVDVRPRSAWASGLGDPPPMAREQPGDVRILLVHHSASPNGYSSADVPGILAGFHRYHTGPEKDWPDIAYNFLVDRFGVVWEGRAGSIDGPVIPDATGGSQGFSQLVCLIGDHTTEPPTAEAKAAVVATLAWLADRDGVATDAGARARFTSRGSNLFAAGAPVDLPTIAGHRQVSQTTCPGDAAFAWVAGDLRSEVDAARSNPGGAGSEVEEAEPTSDTESTTTTAETSTPASETSTSIPTSTSTPTSTSSTSSSAGSGRAETAAERGASGDGDDGGVGPLAWLLPGAGGVVAVAAAAIAVRRRRL